MSGRGEQEIISTPYYIFNHWAPDPHRGAKIPESGTAAGLMAQAAALLFIWRVALVPSSAESRAGPGTRHKKDAKGANRMLATGVVAAVAVLGVCAAWCCGRDTGWREAARTEESRDETFKALVWHLANTAADLDDFKAKYARWMVMEEGETENDG